MTLCNPTGGKCNQEEGHEGDHGMAVGGGLIIAPWPNAGSTEVERLVELNCDICGEWLRMAKGPKGGTLSCTAESCNQSHTFAQGPERIEWSYVILGKLFPSRYKSAHEMPSEMQKEFVEYNAAVGTFYTQGVFVLGLIDQKERERQHAVNVAGVKQYWEELARGPEVNDDADRR